MSYSYKIIDGFNWNIIKEAQEDVISVEIILEQSEDIYLITGIQVIEMQENADQSVDLIGKATQEGVNWFEWTVKSYSQYKRANYFHVPEELFPISI